MKTPKPCIGCSTVSCSQGCEVLRDYVAGLKEELRQARAALGHQDAAEANFESEDKK